MTKNTFQLDRKKPVHNRDIIVALIIGVILLAVGYFVDLKFSKSVYDPVNTSWFGIIFAAIGELPVCIGLISAGVFLAISRFKKAKEEREKIDYFFIALGIIGVIAGYYFLFDTMRDIKMFKVFEGKDTVLIIVSIAFSLVFGTAVGFGAYLLSKYSTIEKMFVIGFFLLMLCLGCAIVGNVFKYFWCRPRPRFIAQNEWDGFRSLLQVQPFACFKSSLNGGNADNLKSFPSGHTMYASTGMFVFPLLTLLFPKTENNRILQIALFYGGLLWSIVVLVSRIYAGAHFLSDVAGGMLTAIMVGAIVCAIMFKKQLSEDDPAFE